MVRIALCYFPFCLIVILFVILNTYTKTSNYFEPKHILINNVKPVKNLTNKFYSTILMVG